LNKISGDASILCNVPSFAELLGPTTPLVNHNQSF